jgi:hypothetical protein
VEKMKGLSLRNAKGEILVDSYSSTDSDYFPPAVSAMTESKLSSVIKQNNYYR